MSVRLNPYLSFKDNARQAMEFYHSVFGGELTLSTFAESYDEAAISQGIGENIMHAMLVAENDITLMAADTPPSMEYVQNTTSISLSGDDEATLRGYWEALSASGSVTVPLEKAPWGDIFGMCTDGFGIPWLVNIVGQPQV